MSPTVQWDNAVTAACLILTDKSYLYNCYQRKIHARSQQQKKGVLIMISAVFVVCKQLDLQRIVGSENIHHLPIAILGNFNFTGDLVLCFSKE
jgi:hypothetical protein